MKINKGIQCLVLGLLLSGCEATTKTIGNPDVDGKNLKQVRQTVLEGTWIATCAPMGSGSTSVLMTVSGNQSYTSGTLFSDTACADALGNPVQQWATITVGAEDQKTGLTSIDLDGVTESGTAFKSYNVFEVIDSSLYLGQNSDQESGRATSIEKNIELKKQEKLAPIPAKPAPKVAPGEPTSGKPFVTPTQCVKLAGHYMVNSDNFVLAQTGCTELDRTDTNLDPETFQTSTTTTRYVADDVARPVGSVQEKSYFEANDFVVIDTGTDASGNQATSKFVWSLTHGCACADECIGDTPVTSLVRETYVNGSTTRSDCESWAQVPN